MDIEYSKKKEIVESPELMQKYLNVLKKSLKGRDQVQFRRLLENGRFTEAVYKYRHIIEAFEDSQAENKDQNN